MFYSPFVDLFGQQQVSRDNYTGNWNTPTSWDPMWATPENINPGQDFIINGYITVHDSLEFFPLPGDLIINDTLVILGDLYLSELSNLTVNSNGILIVRGNLVFETNTRILINNYLVVNGDIFAYNVGTGSSFISNTNPVKVFVGGKMRPATLTNNQPDYPALNCEAPITIRYPDSNCSYGNMTDL